MEHGKDRFVRLEAWLDRHFSEYRSGCMIEVGGVTEFEHWTGGFDRNDRFEIGSIRKSFNSALIGRGIASGAVRLEARAADLWPEMVRLSGNERDRTITLHHLASGVSGWLTGDPPGTGFRYNNAAFTAAERVVARMLGLEHDEIAPLAERTFRGALGADSWSFAHWQRPLDPLNFEDPGPKLAIDSTLPDLLRWGRLWLDGGAAGTGQLIPGEWVRRATGPANPRLADSHYGYNWFVNTAGALWPDAPADSYGHAGWGRFTSERTESRAYLWICPSLRTAAALVADERSGFSNDFLEVPMGTVAEWVGLAARAAAVREQKPEQKPERASG